MGGTVLLTGQSTHPPLPLCLKCKQGACVTPGFRRQTECEPCMCQDQQFTYTVVTYLDIITQCSNNNIKEGIIVGYIMMSETST
jgi:hypothetical protein